MHRARGFVKKHWEGEIKLRRKIFLFKRRYMLVFEDGTLLILRHGHIKSEYKINDQSEISLMKGGRFSMKTSGKGTEVITL